MSDTATDKRIALTVLDPAPLEPGARQTAADKIARNLGLPTAGSQRVDAGILHALGELESDGHSAYPQNALADAATELLGVDRPVVAERLDALVGDRTLEQRRLLSGLADAHVDDDLVELGNLHRILHTQLGAQCFANLCFVLGLETRRCCSGHQISSPVDLAMRTLVPSLFNL